MMPEMNKPVIIMHDLRSIQNVGAILRTAACLGDFIVYCTGHTPYPLIEGDPRMPHLAAKQSRAMAKTSLGAENMLDIRIGILGDVLDELREQGYDMVACEQDARSITLGSWVPQARTAVLFGNEPQGVEGGILDQMDRIVEIPMHGNKESLNVASAAAICLHHLTESLIHSNI